MKKIQNKPEKVKKAQSQRIHKILPPQNNVLNLSDSWQEKIKAEKEQRIIHLAAA